ncbi:MAG: hypothetical protein F6K65_01430 [Moorea sp. SIO3C2]|nr:hypothetical protein [Moorena sp. SIO3C2]
MNSLLQASQLLIGKSVVPHRQYIHPDLSKVCNFDIDLRRWRLPIAKTLIFPWS